MTKTYDEFLSVASILMNDQQYDEAFEHYESALAIAPHVAQKIDILNLLGRMKVNLGHNQAGIKHFEQSLALHESVGDELAQKLLPNKATIFNNLGTLYAQEDIAKAIKTHHKAMTIIQSLCEDEPEQYTEHLANTCYSLGGAYFLKGDFYNAQKNYQEVIRIYSDMESKKPDLARPILAITYFQLGAIASEQDKVPEARSYYHKSLHWYEQLMETFPNEFRPYLASVLNNLGVVNRIGGYLTDSKKYYRRTIEEYRLLVENDRDTFLPYYAASLNSLANVYADTWTPEDDLFSGNRGFLSGFGFLNLDQVNVSGQPESSDDDDLKKAEQYYLEALGIYQQLMDNEPELYAHYLATTLHNLGVLFDENKDFDQAKTYYSKALTIRHKLAEQEPEAFDFDVCSTQMNMVTMYQTLMERKVDVSFREVAIELLEDTKKRLSKYSQDKMPASIINMTGDLDYFTEYFEHVTQAELVTYDINIKAGWINEDILSTRDPKEKMAFYAKIIDLYAHAYANFPDHEVLVDNYLAYSADAARLGLSIDNQDVVSGIIDRALYVRPSHTGLLSQKVVFLVKEGRPDDAASIFNLIKHKKDHENHTYDELIRNQLDELGLALD